MQVQITETNYGPVRSSCFVVISFMFQQPICISFLVCLMHGRKYANSRPDTIQIQPVE